MKRILILDPDPGSRETLRLVLARDYAVTAVADVDSAARACAAEPVHLVLADPAGVREGGAALPRALAAAGSAAPLLVVSATPPPRVAAATFAGFLRKPFDLAALREAVGRALAAGAPAAARGDRAVPGGGPPADGEMPRLEDAVRKLERALIAEALQRSRGVQTEAARLLGTTRRILRYKMSKLGISGTESVSPAGRPA